MVIDSNIERLRETRPAIVHLLGPFRVSQDGRVVDLPTSSHRLIAFLALHGAVVERSYAAACLWLDKPDDRAQANLRSALWRLRRCDVPLVRVTQMHVGLDAAVVVDAQRLLSTMRALVDESRDVNLRELEVSDLSVDLLPSWSDDFVELERERFHQMRMHALESLARRLASIGQHARALDAALTALSADPLRESAHRAVIWVHLQEGNTVEAVRQYRSLEDVLRRQLGIRPSVRSWQLVAEHLDRRDRMSVISAAQIDRTGTGRRRGATAPA